MDLRKPIRLYINRGILWAEIYPATTLRAMVPTTNHALTVNTNKDCASDGLSVVFSDPSTSNPACPSLI
jgi:hypothetical protein